MRKTVGDLMSINLDGFQPCDVRGVYGETAEAQVSPVHAFLIGRVLSVLVPPGETLLTAGDGRASTPALLAMLEAGFDRPCLHLGPQTPTPLAYFAKHLFHAHSIVIVTASHNTALCNGFKIQLGGIPPQPDLLDRLRDEVARQYFNRVTLPDRTAVELSEGRAGCPQPAGPCVSQNLFVRRAGDSPPYLDSTSVVPGPPVSSHFQKARRDQAWAAYKRMVAGAFPAAQGLRVALDCMHGCYCLRAPEAMSEMGYAVTALRDTLAADFRGAVPDPADQNQLADLAASVAQNQVAFGVALDGDGDRVRFLDEKGRPVDNGTILVLLFRYLRDTGRDSGRTTVVYDQKTRLAVVRSLREAGAWPVMGRSGHTFIRTRMLREDALLGGENSGHFFWGGGSVYPVPAGDCGLFAAFAVGDMLRHFGRPLSELALEVPESPHYTGDIRGLCYQGDRGELLARLAAAVPRAGYLVSTEDGLRIETPDAFAQLRPSVTESNMLTATFDGAEPRALTALADLVTGLLPPEAETIKAKIRTAVGQHL
jgi:phosphomannomutase